MISKTVENIIKQLRKENLSMEDRNALTTVLLDRLHSLPLSSTFVINSEGITINGRKLDTEQAINFTESCNALKDNYARKILNEQIRYLAINLGIHNCLSLDTMFFAKAALWNMQQMEELIDNVV